MTQEVSATYILNRLKRDGFKTTKLRSQLLKILTANNRPMCVQELTQHLHNAEIKVNKTSIYREIAILQENQIIVELDFLEGKKRYELLQKDHHHHHIICSLCKAIQCVELPEELSGLESWLHKTHNFQVTNHVLEFFGLCRNCQS